jgi:hypothetical protein
MGPREGPVRVTGRCSGELGYEELRVQSVRLKCHGYISAVPTGWESSLAPDPGLKSLPMIRGLPPGHP